MKKTILLIILSLALFSCEEIIENPSLPYQEQLVIRGVLEAGKPISNIRITRTLPPLERYDNAKAIITDAVAYIEYNGMKYSLEYDSQSGFYYNNEIIPLIGGKYSISVESGNMKAEAATTIPDTVVIESFQLNIVKSEDPYYDDYWDYKVTANFKPQSESAYTGFAYQNEGEPYSSWVDYAYQISDTLKNGRISYPLLGISYYYFSDSTEVIKMINAGNYYCHIVSWDKPFYEFFTTRYEGSSDDEIFGTSGINIRGNIKGGIGIFIGRSRAVKKVWLE